MRKIEVTSSQKLSAPQMSKLEKFFLDKDKSAQFEYSVDESILGGVIIKDGDRIYDGSVISQLDKMKKMLIS